MKSIKLVIEKIVLSHVVKLTTGPLSHTIRHVEEIVTGIMSKNGLKDGLKDSLTIILVIVMMVGTIILWDNCGMKE
jgi:type IV secretory pathway VirB2 component (pilin)